VRCIVGLLRDRRAGAVPSEKGTIKDARVRDR
jgi:hypothetical protein